MPNGRSTDRAQVLKQLRARVAKAPEDAGVYRWLNAKGEVLYVGKAKNLRSRLRQYVGKNAQKGQGPWKQALIEQIADVDVTVVNSDLEAIVLETNLIKELKPKYNVMMKDDKNYVYVRITMQDQFPRIDIVRKMEEDGAKYFGPKTSGEQVRKTLNVLRSIFPFRTCRMTIDAVDSRQLTVESVQRAVDSDGVQREQKVVNTVEKITLHSPLSTLHFPDKQKGGRLPLNVICTHRDRPTPCLDHHIGQCSAPCVGTRTPEEYFHESIEGVIRFLKGDEACVVAIIKERMKQAALDRKFELAAALRDRLQDLEGIQQKQIVSDTSGEDADVIGVALLSNRAQVVMLHERGGKVIGESSFSLAGSAESISAVLSQFLPQFYADASDTPDVIVMGESVDDLDVLQKWLSDRKGKSVIIRVPERGKKSHLLELAEKNAEQKAKAAEIKWEAEARNTQAAQESLATFLTLPAPPRRIECYDISHLGGTETVGSMVVFLNGKPANDQYRSFTIHAMKSGMVDDYRALKEVLTRRIRHLDREREVRAWEQKGVTVGKARKAELDQILALLEANSDNLSSDNIDVKDFTVARKNQQVIGIARIFKHPSGLQEVRSVAVSEQERGVKLGQFLVRQILRREKKKVYIVIDPRLEQYYGELGFRYILKPPPVLLEKIEQSKADHPDTPGIVMMYDPLQHKTDSSLGERPDLLVIDGGKGQLSTVVEVLSAQGTDIPVIGLAKREEEVFVPSNQTPIPIPKDNPALFLLMRLRDEAHRSANRHREKRGFKHMKESFLDTVPGIGPETKMALLKHFRSLDRIRDASDDELKMVLTNEQVRALREALDP